MRTTVSETERAAKATEYCIKHGIYPSGIKVAHIMGVTINGRINRQRMLTLQAHGFKINPDTNRWER